MPTDRLPTDRLLAVLAEMKATLGARKRKAPKDNTVGSSRSKLSGSVSVCVVSLGDIYS